MSEGKSSELANAAGKDTSPHLVMTRCNPIYQASSDNSFRLDCHDLSGTSRIIYSFIIDNFLEPRPDHMDWMGS